jgi:transcriptional regulator with XRE-family HTH domain
MRNDGFGASELGARLRKLWVRAQLTQGEAAGRMGLTYSMRKMTVMLLETGRTANPTVQTLGLLLRACGALKETNPELF